METKQRKTEIKFKTDQNNNIITMTVEITSFIDAIKYCENHFTITEIKSIKHI